MAWSIFVLLSSLSSLDNTIGRALTSFFLVIISLAMGYTTSNTRTIAKIAIAIAAKAVGYTASANSPKAIPIIAVTLNIVVLLVNAPSAHLPMAFC
jgi:hypothetical protein